MFVKVHIARRFSIKQQTSQAQSLLGGTFGFNQPGQSEIKPWIPILAYISTGIFRCLALSGKTVDIHNYFQVSIRVRNDELY